MDAITNDLIRRTQNDKWSADQIARGGLRFGYKLVGTIQRDGHRLLDKYVLTGAQGGKSDIAVLLHRGENENEIDVRRTAQRLVGRKILRDRPSFEDGLAPIKAGMRRTCDM